MQPKFPVQFSGDPSAFTTHEQCIANKSDYGFFGNKFITKANWSIYLVEIKCQYNLKTYYAIAWIDNKTVKPAFRVESFALYESLSDCIERFKKLVRDTEAIPEYAVIKNYRNELTDTIYSVVPVFVDERLIGALIIKKYADGRPYGQHKEIFDSPYEAQKALNKLAGDQKWTPIE